MIFSLICIVTAYIYLPSLHHLPRADQLWYLLDTVKTNNLFLLIKDFYSYNRVRVYAPGDSLAFRPVMFIFLGLEKWLFGTNFLLPQAVGIVLHLFLVWRLYKILQLIHPNRIALIFVGYFSTLMIIMDMVVWHHINAYIIFMILILISLYHLVLYVQKEDKKEHHFNVMMISLLIACFTYEIGAIYACLFFIYLCLVAKQEEKVYFKKKYLLVLLPVLLYVASNVIDYKLRSTSIPKSQQQYDMLLLSQVSFSNVGPIFNLSLEMLYKWIQFGLFPTIFRIYPGPRFGIYSFIYETNMVNLQPEMVVNVVVVMALVLFLMNILSFRQSRDKLQFIILIASMLVSYLLLIIVGRTLERGIKNAFEMCTYYTYFPWVYFIIIIYSLLAHETLKKHTPLVVKWLGIILVLILIYLNSALVRKINSEYADSLAPKRLFIDKINRFVKAHRKEPDFSFKIAIHPPEDEIINIRERDIWKDFYLSEILFGRYINNSNPKYILSPEFFK